MEEVKAARAGLYKAIVQKQHVRGTASADFALPSPQAEPLVSWGHFNYQKTLDAGGRNLYEDLILANFISHSVHAPCNMRDVVEQITRHSKKPIPIESLADCLSQPVLGQAKVLFGSTGNCIDLAVANYENLEWWISSKGLNVSIGSSFPIRESLAARYG